MAVEFDSSAFSSWRLTIHASRVTINAIRLPHLAQYLAADALLARFAAGHYSTRRGQDVDSQTSEDTGNIRPANINAAPGLGNALKVRNRRFIAVAVFQVHAQQFLTVLFGGLEVRDVA